MSHVVQDEKREQLTRIVAGASLVVSFAYLAWRWGWTLRGTALWFSLPLVLAETYGLLAAALLARTAWALLHRTSPPTLPDRTVDVFVTSADEPIAIVRKTTLAAREIRYPHTTWLLDDGGRDEMRAVAEELGVRYLRREGRSFGKAGNLNHALQHASGEFLLQLDADHVPLPQMVDRLIGFFADERLAVAQSPQDFYDTHAFTEDVAGRGREVWGDQALFFNVLQPGRDRLGAAQFVGSCAMLRRSALDEVGGFATGTALVGTETSLLLHARGWRSVYHGENLAFGLAPATAHAYLQQQLHRAQGALQALRRYQPLALRGLTVAQRIEYFHSVATPLGSLQRLILYLAPIVFLTTGVFPLRASLGVFALFFVPMVLLRGASFRLLTRGQASLLTADRYWMAKTFTHLLALRGYLSPTQVRYRDRPDESGTVPLRTVAPQLTLLGVTAVALGWAIYARTIGYGAEVPGWGLFALAGAVLLALWHAGLAAHVVQLALAGRHRRGEFRFAESLSVALRVIRDDGKLSSTDIAMTEDLTAAGLALRCMYPIPEGARVELTLPLSSGDVAVRGHVVRHGVSQTQFGTVHRMGVAFDGVPRDIQDAIELHCAQHAMPIERQRRDSVGARTLTRLRDLRDERRVEVGMPALVRTGEGSEARDIGVGLLEDVSPRGGRVSLDHPIEEGTRIALQIPGSSVQASGRVVFVHALETALGMRFVAGFETDAPPESAPAGAAVTVPWYVGIGGLFARGAGAAGARSRAAATAAVQTSRTAAERVTAGSRVAATALGAASTRTAARVRSASDAARAAVAARSTSLRTKGAPPAPVAVPSRASGTVADYGDDAVERIALTPRASAPVEVTQALAEPGGTRVESAPTPPPPAVTPDPDRIVEMEIDGDFSFPMELAVGATVLITEGGRASADISAVHAIVMGTYRGTLRASRTITVGRTAVVEGVLDAPQVQVADGALVNGVRVGLADVGAVPQTDGSTPADDQSIADSSFMDEGTTTAVAEPPAGDDAEPVAHVETASGPEFPPADSARQPTADDEIFVASPIFTDGISRE